MNQYLPYSKCKWLNKKQMDKLLLSSISENSSPGYILDADLEHPDELLEWHYDYPLAPGNLETTHYCSNY